MTAAASSSGPRPRAPQIPFFWWLTASQSAPRAAVEPSAEGGYVASDADYIPSSTADLWRRGRVRSAAR